MRDISVDTKKAKTKTNKQNNTKKIPVNFG